MILDDFLSPICRDSMNYFFSIYEGDGKFIDEHIIQEKKEEFLKLSFDKLLVDLSSDDQKRYQTL
jgi:hypothetical protein